ncbi:chemotaxis protein CheC [Clostridium sp.]|jgi:chemotaxis protein CheC|uniref:chemotaxis protein CheC n=1 Tax=Clostridium sp. TaxID=1506 RepID=UPI00258C987A|nr:chemotaxis protein CheC [Clostridium sp.]MDF2504892.1 chemotaxis protein CheC, inhibitor of methylation [Clostridium sp.]
MTNKISNEDILKELFNISIGKASSVLSEIIEKKILLNVPNVKILSLEDEKNKVHFNEYLNNIAYDAVMLSSISFKEKLVGKASLIFPASKMKKFIKLCLHEISEDQCEDINFTDIDFDVVKEIGNIILNCVLGEFGNYINIRLSYTLPEVKVVDNLDFKCIAGNEEYLYILMLYITFNIEGEAIEGAIIINVTLKSIENILEKITMLEDGFNG